MFIAEIDVTWLA